MSVAGRDTGASRGVQSVEIGMRIIGALGAATGALSLKALAAAAGLPASNCHRYCVSLVRAGYLRQDSRSNRYDLGPRLIEAGLAALARTDAVAVATEALEGLVDATGHTGQLTIWAAQGPTIIRWIHGRAAVRTSIATGTTLPLLTSATGRVFLAYLPARQTAALAAQVRASGIGRVAGDHIPGLSAIAAAVFDVHGEPASVLTLLAARGGIVPGAADQLRAAASAASSRLGFATPCQSGSG
jgi:DNA-binding IclR family transcriptional regulator